MRSIDKTDVIRFTKIQRTVCKLVRGKILRERTIHLYYFTFTSKCSLYYYLPLTTKRFRPPTNRTGTNRHRLDTLGILSSTTGETYLISKMSTRPGLLDHYESTPNLPRQHSVNTCNLSISISLLSFPLLPVHSFPSPSVLFLLSSSLRLSTRFQRVPFSPLI